jgi:hypothetical protein
VNRIEEDLTFDKTPESPLLETGFTGVRIGYHEVIEKNGVHRYWIRGAYAIPREDADRISSGPLQRALVLTWTYGLVNATYNILGDRILMVDDEETDERVRRGYFNLRVDTWLKAAGLGRESVYVTLSLGHWLSNTLALSAPQPSR